MKLLDDVQTRQVEYLGVLGDENLDLKVYRCALQGATCENGLLVRQTEYLIEQLPPLLRNVRQGYVIMLKGVDFNHFKFGLFNQRNRKIISHNYSMPSNCRFEFKAVKNDGEIFMKHPELKALVEYEYSLIGYIKRKGHYNDFHF
ncbi:MAG: hypothetical protein RLO12_00220 [Fulvivirga sp.]